MAKVTKTKSTLVTSKKKKVSSTQVPPGTKALKIEAEEVVVRDAENHTSFVSHDGQSYVFRTHYIDGKDRKVVPHRNELALFLCMREISIGGTPDPVMAAFKLRLEDADGKPLYPLM